MWFAVKLYESMPSDDFSVMAGIPLACIAEQVDLGDSTELPEGAGWVLMSHEETANYAESQRANYEAWFALSAYAPPPTQEAIVKSVSDAMAFGNSLILEFGSMSVISQLTSAQIIEISTRLAPLQSLLSSGALYTSLYAIQYITPDALLPQAVLDYFEARIRNHLGI